MKRRNQSVDSVNSRTSTSSILVVSRNDLSSEIISLREQNLCPNIERRLTLIGSLRVSNGGRLGRQVMSEDVKHVNTELMY
jgi:hypothetical protein